MIDLIDIGLVLPGLGCSGWLAWARRCWISGVRSFAILRRARVERMFCGRLCPCFRLPLPPSHWVLWRCLAKALVVVILSSSDNLVGFPSPLSRCSYCDSPMLRANRTERSILFQIANFFDFLLPSVAKNRKRQVAVQ